MPSTRQTPTARDRLLAAAEELFYARGIAATGVDAVIARAGVATGSLYNNFAGKDALVAAYLESRDHRWRARWEEAVAEQSEPVARVLALFTAVRRWDRELARNRGCAHLAATLQLPPDSPGATAAREHKRHLRRRLRALTAAAGAGDDVADGIALVYEGMLALLALGLDPDPVTRAEAQAEAILRTALARA